MFMIRLLIPALLSCAAWSAFAQVKTPAPLLNETVQRVDEQPERNAGVPSAPVQAELNKPLNDLTVDVTAYAVSGAGAEHAEAIAQRLLPFTGKARTFEDLSNAARTVTAYMQSEFGYYLAYAYLPAQDVDQGVVKIEVLPGVLESIEVNWPESLRVNRAQVEGHLAALKPGKVLHVSEVERVVFLLNDLRGIDVTFAVKPGTQLGKAILVASPRNADVVSGSIAFDNHGSRFAGSNRITLSASWDSPLGRGDSLSFSHLRSDTEGLAFTLLGYTTPVGFDGWKVGINTSRVDYALNENDFPLLLNGYSESVGAFALYPIARSRNLNLFGLLGFDTKEFDDRQSLADLKTLKRVDTWRAGLSGDSRDRVFSGGLSFFNLSYEKSNVIYPNGRPFGLDDEPDAAKAVYSYGRLQTLVPARLLLWSYMRGQYAYDNLDSSDQCSLGGATGVRAFAQGESAGDTCGLFTLELRHLSDLPMLGNGGREFSFNLFYDEGRTRLRKDSSQQLTGFRNLDKLAGYGFGFSWDRPNEFLFNLSLAWELEGVRRSDPKRQSPRILASFTHHF